MRDTGVHIRCAGETVHFGSLAASGTFLPNHLFSDHLCTVTLLDLGSDSLHSFPRQCWKQKPSTIFSHQDRQHFCPLSFNV